MIVKKALSFEDVGSTYVDITEPNICPQCKHAIKPEEINAKGFYDSSKNAFACFTYLCKSCYNPFICLHSCSITKPGLTYHVSAKLMYIEPTKYTPTHFDSHIISVSPSFAKIYNQAKAAEAVSLDEIAGIGYRKALEFLIKDYLNHIKPDSSEAIAKMELGNCIANKIENERLKTVASRSAWIGNDMTHYVQRFEDKDINDMKKFIDACVYWISMELITEEALGITKRDR